MYNHSNSGENRVRGDNVNKEKLMVLLKSKGFYLSLLTGVLAVFALCFVYLNTVSVNDSKKNLTDLNEPVADVAENNSGEDSAINNQTNNTEGDSTTGQTENSNQADAVKETAVPKDSLLENDVETEAEENGNVVIEDTEENDDQAKGEDSVAVISQEKKTVDSLTFDEEKGLLWPITGDVILDYSMDRGVYFSTLGQYKCNPAIVIGAKEGTKVKSASKAVVTKIEEDDETGITVTTSIGNDYSVIYGQLKDVKVKEGQTIKEGAVIGEIAKPTKYYVVEGANLYFQVTQEDEAVNPLLLLR